MKKRHLYYRYLILMVPIITIIGFSNPVWASTPQIYSITPDFGINNKTSTNVTIKGADFQPTLTVALYGGDLSITGTITGTCDTPKYAKGVHVAGTYAYVADAGSGLQVIDISDPAKPAIVGACDTPKYAKDVHVAGTYAYVADTFSGLQVIDISDPAKPAIVGACDTPGLAWSIHVAGSYAYVADDISGLQVINISDPAKPAIVGACVTRIAGYQGLAVGVHVAGSYAFVADTFLGLVVIDISVPENPGIVGSCYTSGLAYDVHVSGPYAYVANGNLGLQVINISDPAKPAIVGACDMPGLAVGVHVAGSYAFVADDISGLQVIDISNPAKPAIVGASDMPDRALGVYVAGSYAYVADAGSGLQVIEKFSPLADISYLDSSTLTATVPAGYCLGTYNLHVTNPDGGYAVLRNAFTSGGVLMELPAGWSMISLPVRPEIATVGTLFPEAKVLYTYQKGTGYIRVQAGENLKVGRGYWILLDNPQSYILSGTAITEYTLSVEDGWYMIGGCTLPADKMVITGSIDVIYEYTQGSGYTLVTGSGSLEPGKGYWIKFSNTWAAFTTSTSVSE